MQGFGAVRRPVRYEEASAFPVRVRLPLPDAQAVGGRLTRSSPREHPRHQGLVLGAVNAEAVRYLQAFLATHPDNAVTKNMVEAIEAGQVGPM